jgi:hypothetical protein
MAVATREKPVAIIDDVMSAAELEDRLEAEDQPKEPSLTLLEDLRPTFIPEDESFASLTEPDWKFDATLQKVGKALIKDCPELGHLAPFRFKFAWKRKGGQEKGQPRLGGVVRGNAVLRELGSTDFVVWLAADHCRDFSVTDRQRDANLFHQLSHCSVDEQGKPFISGHDFEGFESEVHRYGAWSVNLQRSAPVLLASLQPTLPGLDG